LGGTRLFALRHCLGVFLVPAHPSGYTTAPLRSDLLLVTALGHSGSTPRRADVTGSLGLALRGVFTSTSGPFGLRCLPPALCLSPAGTASGLGAGSGRQAVRPPRIAQQLTSSFRATAPIAGCCCARPRRRRTHPARAPAWYRRITPAPSTSRFRSRAGPRLVI